MYTDPKALGHLYVGPYLRLQPELAFVLGDASGVCGYALAALDSERFFAAYRNEWLPEIRRNHPDPAGDPATWTPTQQIYHQYHHPRIFLPDSFKDYPSHLHIDLLLRGQGQGNGRRMMERLLEALKTRGSIGVHLAMAASNQRAEKFYRKLGFTELARIGSGKVASLYLGKRV
ncbi:MAG: GNAT family N-acetyltransferase [Verrucomicrobia bacterium]|nr:GNAT family N-acetyltransferase [Verrucomicrobiota bacterium]